MMILAAVMAIGGVALLGGGLAALVGPRVRRPSYVGRHRATW